MALALIVLMFIVLAPLKVVFAAMRQKGVSRPSDRFGLRIGLDIVIVLNRTGNDCPRASRFYARSSGLCPVLPSPDLRQESLDAGTWRAHMGARIMRSLSLRKHDDAIIHSGKGLAPA
jgi:hypothetical protein